MTRTDGWRPTASLETLRRRAEITARIRGFFADRNVLEVETPSLSATGVSDPAIESISASARSLNAPMYLATSPEYAMKRLLAAGSGDIFQICKVFRDDELGRWHQPEFTLLEWYRTDFDDSDMMTEVDALFREVLSIPISETLRLSYREAFQQHLGVDPYGDPSEVRKSLADTVPEIPSGLDADGLLDLAFATVVVPRLEGSAITFIYDYPANQAALARLKSGTPAVAARFEAFCGGLELANGFWELTDAAEQAARFEADIERRKLSEQHVPPLDRALLDALSEGLPPCAGVAVGIDRVIALAIGAESIAETLSFAHRPERRDDRA